MRIIFVGLISHYTDGLMYQDNYFNKVLAESGHDILYLADTQYFDNGVLKYAKSREFIDVNGVRIIRIPYLFSNFVGSKIKVFKSIYKYIDEFKPDIIYCHSPQYLSVLEIIKFKKRHPNVILYADTHTGYNNVNISKFYFTFLYKIYYKKLFKSLEPYMTKYFYITSSDKKFSEEIFDADKSKMHYLPLGGEAIDEEKYNEYRNKKRKELNFSDNDVVLIHSGKLDRFKNTDWLLETISLINSNNLKLVIIGNIPSNNNKLINTINNNANKNVIYLGWKDSTELMEYICACDIYVQPGGASVTLNNSVCYQTPIIANKQDLYSMLYDVSSICWINSIDDLINMIKNILKDKSILVKLKEEAKKNKFLLDYKTNLLKELNL